MRVRLDYAPGADAGPRSLFLKTLRDDVGPDLVGAGRKEASFYSSVAPLTPAGLLPRCYEATFRDEGPTFRLLLEDLSDTHVVISQWPLPPTVDQ